MDHRKLQKFLPFAHRNKVPVMLWGPTGIGKTTAVYEYGEKIGAKVIVLHLASQEPGDLIGLPFRDPENNTTVHLRPEWLPKEDDPGKYIFFLDEFNRAPKFVLACMFPFILEGRLHTHFVPKDSWIIVAGNPNDDDYDVTEMHDRALISRLCHVKLAPDPQEWLDRYTEGVHDAVVKVIAKEPQFLAFGSCEIGFDVRPDARAITNMGAALKNIKPEEFTAFGFEFMAGCVGQTMAEVIRKEWKDGFENISAIDILDSYSKVRKQVQKFSNVSTVRNDILAAANRKLVTEIKRRGEEEGVLKEKQLENLKTWIKDIPRDSAQSLLTLFGSNEYRILDVFKQLMLDLGEDDDLFIRILEANDAEEAAKMKSEAATKAAKKTNHKSLSKPSLVR